MEKFENVAWTLLVMFLIYMLFNLIQSPFVLCRLFKKQDDSIEGVNCEEAETTVSSPITKSSPVNTQSEQEVTPGPLAPRKQPEMLPTKIEYSTIETSDDMTSEAGGAIAFPSNSYSAYDAGDQGIEETASEVSVEGLSLCLVLFSVG